MVCSITTALILAAPVQAKLTPARLRQLVYKSHPCLARIIDREDGTWDPTRSYGGGHDIYASYGLGQADPGTKMAAFGKNWATSPWVQLRWMERYADERYGSECSAWAFWQAHSYW